MLPYSREVYFSLFAELNSAFSVWVILAALLSLDAVLLVFWRGRPQWAVRVVLLEIACLWCGAAWCWYFQTFAGLNFLAPVYGWFAIAVAAVFVMVAIIQKPLANASVSAGYAAKGVALLAVLWPLLDLLAGPGWPALRFVGLHPVPLLLLSLSVVLALVRRGWIAGCLLMLLLALAGVSAYEAFVLQMAQDFIPLGTAALVWGFFSVSAFSVRASNGGRV